MSSIWADSFWDFWDSNSTVRRLAKAMHRQWGKGAMKVGEELSPTDFGHLLWIFAGYLADIRSYIEAVGVQAYPHLAEYSIDEWEYTRNIPPSRTELLLGDRLMRILAYCQTRMGARPSDIKTALENLAGVLQSYLLERGFAWPGASNDYERMYEVYTLLFTSAIDDSDIVDDINTILDRWKPAHVSHGSYKAQSAGAPGPYGGCREADPSDIETPKYFKTGPGPEKTSKNLIERM